MKESDLTEAQDPEIQAAIEAGREALKERSIPREPKKPKPDPPEFCGHCGRGGVMRYPSLPRPDSPENKPLFGSKSSGWAGGRK